MSDYSAFSKLIPALPGTRLAELWGDDPERPSIDYEVVIAWAETEDRPGELLPVVDTNEAITAVRIERGGIYLAVLHPGQTIDLDDPEQGWRGRIATWREARREASAASRKASAERVAARIAAASARLEQRAQKAKP